jgi:peptidyl-prolyl cis-trans isomerase A (cyclophilin A)
MHNALLKFAIATVMLFTVAAYATPTERVTVVLETELGRVVLAIDTNRTPLAAAYFLDYIDRGQYDGATLYRSLPMDGEAIPQLVQGGVLKDALNSTQPIDLASYGVKTLLPEWTTTAESGTRHRRGSVSLARDLLDTGHVIPEIVFSLRDISRMDSGENNPPDGRGFPVIGEVITGMDIIDAVSQRETQGATNIAFLQGQILSTPVPITRAYRQQPLND